MFNKDEILRKIKKDAREILKYKELLENESFFKEVIDENIFILKFLDSNYFENLDIIEYAIGKNALILSFAPPKICDNYQLILKGVKNYGGALKYASDRLKKDETICLEAINRDFISFMYIDRSLIENISFIKKALKINGMIIQFIDDKFKTLDICKLALKKNIEAYFYFPEDVKKDLNLTEEEMLYLIQDGLEEVKYFKFFTQNICNEIYKCSLEDWEFYDTILEENSFFNAFPFIPSQFLTENMVNFILATNLFDSLNMDSKKMVLKFRPDFLEELGEKKMQNPVLCLEAIKSNEYYLDFINDENLKKDLMEALIDDTLNEFEKLYPKYF